MTNIRLQDVMCRVSVLTGGFFRHKSLCLVRRKPQVQHEVFLRQLINAVFEMFDPRPEFGSFFRRRACALVRWIRTTVTVGKNHSAAFERGYDRPLAFKAIACVKQGREVWVY